MTLSNSTGNCLLFWHEIPLLVATVLFPRICTPQSTKWTLLIFSIPWCTIQIHNDLEWCTRNPPRRKLVHHEAEGEFILIGCRESCTPRTWCRAFPAANQSKVGQMTSHLELYPTLKCCTPRKMPNLNNLAWCTTNPPHFWTNKITD